MDSLPGSRAGVGIMRRQQNVIHLQKRTIERKRLKFKDIHSGSCETFDLQRFDQRVLVDDGSAGGVDQHGVWFHQSERIAVDEMITCWVQVAVDRDEVRLGE